MEICSGGFCQLQGKCFWGLGYICEKGRIYIDLHKDMNKRSMKIRRLRGMQRRAKGKRISEISKQRHKEIFEYLHTLRKIHGCRQGGKCLDCLNKLKKRFPLEFETYIKNNGNT